MKRTFINSMIAVLVVLPTLLAPALCLAQAPQTLSYQGVLKNDDGTPVPDGNYDLTFHIYGTASGGTALWTEAHTVPVVNATFNAVLGSTETLDLPFDVPYWLGIQVEGDPELTPRIELTAAPYALNVADGKVVRSVNSLTDDVTLAAGTNVSISPSGNTLTISATGTGADSDWVVNGNNMHSAVSGDVGIGTSLPGTKLHVQTADLGADAATWADAMLIEANDAILGLYSGEGGSGASGLTLGVMDGGALVDKWAMIRQTTSEGSGLRFTYGTNADQWQNSTVLFLDDTGYVAINGRHPTADLDVNGQVRIRGGSPGAGKVLTSDSDGVATWEAVTTSYVISPTFLQCVGTNCNIDITNSTNYTYIEHEDPAGGIAIVLLPIQIPMQIGETPQRFHRVTAYYQVEGDCYINRTSVHQSGNDGNVSLIFFDETDRTSTAYTSYTITESPPASISGYLSLRFYLDFADDTGQIRIGSVIMETAE